MINTELLYVAVWVLASVAVGLSVGFCLGRGAAAHAEGDAVKRERDEVLKGLLLLLKSTEQLSNDVDTHNLEIAQVGRHVGHMQLDGQMRDVQRSLLKEIGDMLEANDRLEEDLQFTRYRMEQQAQELDRTRREARTDDLSGVANRKAFDETLQYLLTGFRRQREPFVLILTDVDHFKWINDTHGHPAGDRVVTHLGALLQSLARQGDFVARYGGDEFAILAPQTDLATGHRLAERVRLAVARNNFDAGIRGERVAVTCSMGVAEVREGDTAESLIRRADEGVYRSKESGRNQVHLPAGEVDDGGQAVAQGAAEEAQPASRPGDGQPGNGIARRFAPPADAR